MSIRICLVAHFCFAKIAAIVNQFAESAKICASQTPMDDDCCANICSPCCVSENGVLCTPCEHLCCCDDGKGNANAGKEKSREETRREQQKMVNWLRVGIYAGYLFAFVAVWTQPHIMWRNYILFGLFWLLYISSIYCYEILRGSHPGFIPTDDIQAFHKRRVAKREQHARLQAADRLSNSSQVLLSQSDATGTGTGTTLLRHEETKTTTVRRSRHVEAIELPSSTYSNDNNEIALEMEDPFEASVRVHTCTL